MNKYQKINIVNALVLIATIAFGFSLKSSLPEIIPTKFNEAGVAIKFAPIIPSIFFLPIIAVFTVWILTFLSKKNTNFWSKEHNREAVAQTNLGILFLIACLYIGTFLNALNFNMFFKYSYFAIGFGLFFIISSGPMKKIEQNFLYGVRLPWTMGSALNWQKTHELTSKLMLIAGCLLVVVGFVTKNHLIILTLVAGTLLVPVLYSYKIKNLK